MEKRKRGKKKNTVSLRRNLDGFVSSGGEKKLNYFLHLSFFSFRSFSGNAEIFRRQKQHRCPNFFSGTKTETFLGG